MSHTFCRLMLKDIMNLVHGRVSPEDIKKSWVWKCKTSGTFEFHGPHNFYYVSSQADCLWSIKAEGWEAYIEMLDRQERTCYDL